MKALRIGVITACVAAASGGYFLMRGAATHEAQSPQATGAQTPSLITDIHQPVSRSGWHALESRAISDVSELAFEPDTTGLLAPPPTLDELLDAFNADVGDEGEQIDRDAVGAALRADPALARILRPAGT